MRIRIRKAKQHVLPIKRILSDGELHAPTKYSETVYMDKFRVISGSYVNEVMVRTLSKDCYSLSDFEFHTLSPETRIQYLGVYNVGEE